MSRNSRLKLVIMPKYMGYPGVFDAYLRLFRTEQTRKWLAIGLSPTEQESYEEGRLFNNPNESDPSRDREERSPASRLARKLSIGETA